MGTTLQRTARTMFVKEAADFATALVGLDGKLFAHPRASGVSLFVDCDCTATIGAVPNLEPGDIIITNDAFTSGGSLPTFPTFISSSPIITTAGSSPTDGPSSIRRTSAAPWPAASCRRTTSTSRKA